jgi:signal transduction histidine kinase
MNKSLRRVTQRYQAAMRRHLEQAGSPRLDLARGLGTQALEAGLKTLDLAKLHEHVLLTAILPQHPEKAHAALIRRAGAFFAAAMTQIEQDHRSVKEATAHLKDFIETLSQRTVELAAANLALKQEISHRRTAEEALRESERHYADLLKQSKSMQDHLRLLSRQILTAQEEERKNISRELHDVIAQTLTGINIRLATLRREAMQNVKGLDRNITRTQLLVEKSVNIVHQFARELRPAVLDDLGLIPALQTYLKSFATRTGVHARMVASSGVENLNFDRRTVLFRVAQEALTNVARHAHASQVQIRIKKLSGSMCMTIHDDGRSFNAQRALQPHGTPRLGLLGMRERLEMVDGRLDIVSSPGRGTTITAQIPIESTVRIVSEKRSPIHQRKNP